MPQLEADFRHRWALLWPATGVNDYGVTTVGNRDEIAVRWDESKSRGGDPNSEGTAFPTELIVARTIPVGSMLWLGKVTDLPGTSEVPERDLMRVTTYREVYDEKGRHRRRLITLARWSSAPPVVA